MSNSTPDDNQDYARPYHNPETLERLYCEKGMTLQEVADELYSTPGTISRWMEKHGIDRRSGRPPSPDVTILTKKNGYVQIFDEHDGEMSSCYLHQLVAISDGADPRKVFSRGEYNVHHINNIRWDNRPSNVRLLRATEHGEITQRREKGKNRSRNIRGEFLSEGE